MSENKVDSRFGPDSNPDEAFLLEVERRAGASREEMMFWIENASGDVFVCSYGGRRLADYLRSILGGDK